MADKPKLRVLLVSTSNIWVRSMRTVLANWPDLDVPEAVTGGLTAFQSVPENYPCLIVVDSSIPTEEAVALVRSVKNGQQSCYCLVVIATSQAAPLFKRAGADDIVLRGDITTALLAAVSALIPIDSSTKPTKNR